jgi:50S ribosomal subunit-associated GTPase HflX
MVCNKMDLGADPEVPPFQEGIPVSARTGEGLDELRRSIAAALGVGAPTDVLLAPEDGRTRAWLYSLGAVMQETVAEDGRLALRLRADRTLIERLDGMPTVLLQQTDPVHKLSSLAN